jgi:deazaflavin-dependent oxidoreductase (nitroreductase family)
MRKGTLKFTVVLDRTIGRAVYRMHRRMYRLTNGWIGHRSPLGPILLLTTTGRSSGQLRTAPLLYFAKDGQYFVVASNGGRKGDPNWLLNVRQGPNVEVQVGSRRFRTVARELDPRARERLWPALTTFYSGWAHYATLTERPIPVVALVPGP